MNGYSEEQLVASCRNGDKSAYTGLVRAYCGRVFAICLGILGNKEDAEDIAQQTLLKGFTDINELRRSEQFGAWIGRIAKNLCIDFMRRQKRTRNALAQRVEAGQPARRMAGQNSPKEYPELERTLAKLPEQYKLALMLYYFDGKSAKNIAETLETSETAIHTKLSRARKELRKLLTAEGGE